MKKLKLLFLIVIFIFIQCMSVNAAKQEFRFEKIDFGSRIVGAEGTTIKGLGRGKLRALGKPKTWGVIETVYESLPKWADDVVLRYYLLLKSRRGEKQVVLASKITYVHVEKGKHHFSNIYMPPQVLRRYGEVLRIRAEIWYNGILQDAIQWPRKKSKTSWWSKIEPRYGSLMNRFYTPFEHEAQLKEEVIKIQ